MTVTFSNSSRFKLQAVRAGHIALDLEKIKEEILADWLAPKPACQPETGSVHGLKEDEETDHAA